MNIKRIFCFAVVAVSVLPAALRAQVPRFEWVRHLSGPKQITATAVAIDHLDNIYVCGQFEETVRIGSRTLSSAGGDDIFLAKFDPNGTVLWAKRLGGSGFDNPQGMAVDGNGNVLITGGFTGPATFDGVTLPGFGLIDIFAAKLDSDGNLLWARQAGGSESEVAAEVTTDNLDNVIVTGYIASNPTDFDGTMLATSGRDDMFLAKYDPAGNLLWVKKGGGVDNDIGTGVAVGPGGHILVTGGFFSLTMMLEGIGLSNLGAMDLFIASYDSDGRLMWAKAAGGAGGIEVAEDIVTDAGGNIFVSGQFNDGALFDSVVLSTSGRPDFFLAKYSGAGDLLWVRQANATKRGFGPAITTDPAGNAYLLGVFHNEVILDGITLSSPTDTLDILVVKLDPDGLVRWAMRAGGDHLDAGGDIALNSNQDIFIPGFFQEETTLGDFSLVSAGQRDAFLAKILEFSVLARAECAGELPQGCPVSVPITIDVSGTSPPENLGSFTGTLTWDAAVLRFTGHSGLLAGFTGAVNETDVSSGELPFNGANTAGTAGKTEVLRVDFEVIGTAGSSGNLDLSFSAMAAAGTFRDLLPDLTVQGCSFTISEAGLLGDVNGDGLVNSTDALIVLSFDVGFEVPEDIRARIDSGIGDVNADGVTNSTDALIILSFDVGFEVPFKLGERFCPGS